MELKVVTHICRNPNSWQRPRQGCSQLRLDQKRKLGMQPSVLLPSISHSSSTLRTKYSFGCKD